MKKKNWYLLPMVGLFFMISQSIYSQNPDLSKPEKVCKCGMGCKCKQSGDMSQCSCGDNCKCEVGASMGGHSHTPSNHPFLKMMDVMMVQMDTVSLSGSFERNFLLQMIPHHRGAVEMAKHEIAHGKSFEMIQLAKSILAEQQGEIMEMEAMLKFYPKSSEKPIYVYKKAMDETMQVMMKHTPTDKVLPNDVDCCFAMVMLPHHQAAVDMAMALLKLNPKSPLAVYARRIIGDQQIEIEQMSTYIEKNCKK